MIGTVHRSGRVERLASQSRPDAFSLVELLVVMGMIGILATIALPSIRGIGRSNSITAANRQILDDIAAARQRAINTRSTVYMVFVPSDLFNRYRAENDPNELRKLTNLFTGQYTSYALMSKRTVGDQPGRETPRYLTEWKNLPDGAIFPPYKYTSTDNDIFTKKFDSLALPFPTAQSKTFNVPIIAFNAKGQLASQQDVVIPIAQGSIFYPRTSNDQPIWSATPDIVVTPGNNYTNNFIRINWLTGRAALVKPKMP